MTPGTSSKWWLLNSANIFWRLLGHSWCPAPFPTLQNESELFSKCHQQLEVESQSDPKWTIGRKEDATIFQKCQHFRYLARWHARITRVPARRRIATQPTANALDPELNSCSISTSKIPRLLHTVRFTPWSCGPFLTSFCHSLLGLPKLTENVTCVATPHQQNKRNKLPALISHETTRLCRCCFSHCYYLRLSGTPRTLNIREDAVPSSKSTVPPLHEQGKNPKVYQTSPPKKKQKKTTTNGRIMQNNHLKNNTRKTQNHSGKITQMCWILRPR